MLWAALHRRMDAVALRGLYKGCVGSYSFLCEILAI